jgi:hypothetical protein
LETSLDPTSMIGTCRCGRVSLCPSEKERACYFRRMPSTSSTGRIGTILCLPMLVPPRLDRSQGHSRDVFFSSEARSVSRHCKSSAEPAIPGEFAFDRGQVLCKIEAARPEFYSSIQRQYNAVRASHQQQRGFLPLREIPLGLTYFHVLSRLACNEACFGQEPRCMRAWRNQKAIALRTRSCAL